MTGKIVWSFSATAPFQRSGPAVPSLGSERQLAERPSLQRFPRPHRMHSQPQCNFRDARSPRIRLTDRTGTRTEMWGRLARQPTPHLSPVSFPSEWLLSGRSS